MVLPERPVIGVGVWSRLLPSCFTSRDLSFLADDHVVESLFLILQTDSWQEGRGLKFLLAIRIGIMTYIVVRVLDSFEKLFRKKSAERM